MDAKRAARLDLSSYSEAEARAALAEARPVIAAEVKRCVRFLSVCGLEADDLRAIAEIAALEARLTYENGRQCSLKTWVSRTIRWRLREALQDELSRPEEPSDGADAVMNGHNPEASLERVRRQQWVRTAVGRLDPRGQILMAARMMEESQRQTASTLGISPSRVSQEVHLTFQVLREWAEDDEVEPSE